MTSEKLLFFFIKLECFNVGLEDENLLDALTFQCSSVRSTFR